MDTQQVQPSTRGFTPFFTSCFALAFKPMATMAMVIMNLPKSEMTSLTESGIASTVLSTATSKKNKLNRGNIFLG